MGNLFQLLAFLFFGKRPGGTKTSGLGVADLPNVGTIADLPNVVSTMPAVPVKISPNMRAPFSEISVDPSDPGANSKAGVSFWDALEFAREEYESHGTGEDSTRPWNFWPDDILLAITPAGVDYKNEYTTPPLFLVPASHDSTVQLTPGRYRASLTKLRVIGGPEAQGIPGPAGINDHSDTWYCWLEGSKHKQIMYARIQIDPEYRRRWMEFDVIQARTVSVPIHLYVKKGELITLEDWEYRYGKNSVAGGQTIERGIEGVGAYLVDLFSSD